MICGAAVSLNSDSRDCLLDGTSSGLDSLLLDESVASLGGLSFVKLGDRDMNFWDEGRPPTRRTRRETGKKEECG